MANSAQCSSKAAQEDDCEKQPPAPSASLYQKEPPSPELLRASAGGCVEGNQQLLLQILESLLSLLHHHCGVGSPGQIIRDLHPQL